MRDPSFWERLAVGFHLLSDALGSEDDRKCVFVDAELEKDEDVKERF